MIPRRTISALAACGVALAGMQPVQIEAAELSQALATGVAEAFVSSGSTGYDEKVWEHLSHFYEADACLAMVKEAHAPFYRRVFRSTLLAGPKKFDDFAVPLVLFASPRQYEQDVYRRYPMFASTVAERRMMFASDATSAPLTVLPTAKYVAEAA